MAKRKREIQMKFRVDENEYDTIHARATLVGTTNIAAYLRKMALDGYIVKLDFPELKEMVTLQRRYNNNLNQIARRVNETGRVYEADMEEIKQEMDSLWEAVESVIREFSKLK